MGSDEVIHQQRLDSARELVAQIEAGNKQEVERLLEELNRQREQNLFQQLGKLTRELHEALNSFRMDSRITSLAEKEIPDAKERLSYVVEMTEQAAHRTLNAVEESLPLSEELGRRAGELQGAWARFRQREMSADEFRDLSRDIEAFLGDTSEKSDRIRDRLSDVLMAQDFQDLTGQVIKRVTTLVQEVEENLVGLIRISGQHLLGMAEGKPVKSEEEKRQEKVAAEGPQMASASSTDVVSGQDEVDDLLSSLGF